VALWGDVVEHEKGYRARYAYPTKLYVRHPQAKFVAACLEAAYGVSCEPSPLSDYGLLQAGSVLQQSMSPQDRFIMPKNP